MNRVRLAATLVFALSVVRPVYAQPKPDTISPADPAAIEDVVAANHILGNAIDPRGRTVFEIRNAGGMTEMLVRISARPFTV